MGMFWVMCRGCPPCLCQCLPAIRMQRHWRRRLLSTTPPPLLARKRCSLNGPTAPSFLSKEALPCRAGRAPVLRRHLACPPALPLRAGHWTKHTGQTTTADQAPLLVSWRGRLGGAAAPVASTLPFGRRDSWLRRLWPLLPAAAPPSADTPLRASFGNRCRVKALEAVACTAAALRFGSRPLRPERALAHKASPSVSAAGSAPDARTICESVASRGLHV